MMQPTRELVITKIEALFPSADRDAVLRTLDEYEAEGSQANVPRVQLAILKLSEGKLDRVQQLVESARRDYRDILAQAEFPGQIAAGFAGPRQRSMAERRRLERDDRAQYLAWLRG